MSNVSAKVQLNKNLTLYTHNHFSTPLCEMKTALMKHHQKCIEFRLTGRVTPKLYQTIDTQALFNLQPIARSPFSNGEFRPDRPIQIELTLKPELLPRLLEHANTTKAATDYLMQLSQEQENQGEDEEIDPLLLAENWLALSVTQTLDSGETTGYRTFWSIVSPLVFSQDAASTEEIAGAIASFIAECTNAKLSTKTGKATSDLFEGVTRFFNDLAEGIPNSIAEDAKPDLQTKPASSRTITEQMLNFFAKEDWSFIKLQREPTLKLAFQGQNGIWTCYAKTREEHQQMMFYSLCPVHTPEDKRQPIAEFLTRVNYGMILGNFELNFDNGEIRYKTSIDVTDDRLSFALIQQLVYTNVTIMDQYLPGIQSVLTAEASPAEAIRAIEEPNIGTQSDADIQPNEQI